VAAAKVCALPSARSSWSLFCFDVFKLNSAQNEYSSIFTSCHQKFLGRKVGKKWILFVLKMFHNNKKYMFSAEVSIYTSSAPLTPLVWRVSFILAMASGMDNNVMMAILKYAAIKTRSASHLLYLLFFFCCRKWRRKPKRSRKPRVSQKRRPHSLWGGRRARGTWPTWSRGWAPSASQPAASCRSRQPPPRVRRSAFCWVESNRPQGRVCFRAGPLCLYQSPIQHLYITPCPLLRIPYMVTSIYWLQKNNNCELKASKRHND